MRDNPFHLLRAPLMLGCRDAHAALGADPGVFDSAPVVVEAATSADLPGALAQLLGPHPRRRVQLRLGDEHARLFHLARPRGARSPRELEAALRQRSEQLFGDDGAGWTLRWSGSPWAASDTVCALPTALLAALQASCRAARVRCTSLRTDWIAAATQAPRRGRLWVLNAGARTLTLGLLADGRCVGVRRLSPPAPDDDLADVMARAQPLFAGRAEDALAPVWLFGSPLPVPPGDAAARVRRGDATPPEPLLGRDTLVEHRTPAYGERVPGSVR